MMEKYQAGAGKNLRACPQGQVGFVRQDFLSYAVL